MTPAAREQRYVASLREWLARRLSPERTYFTHICHDLAHGPTSARLPAGVHLAYDGLALDVDVDA